MADDALRGDLANSTDLTKGAALVGYRNRTVTQRLQDVVSPEDFGATGDSAAADTAAFVAMLASPFRKYMPDPGNGTRFLRTWTLGPQALG